MGFKGEALKRRAAAPKTRNRSTSLARDGVGKIVDAVEEFINELPIS